MATESLPERAVGRRRPELEPRQGMRLGRYELLVPLASGGMAQVWVARLAGEHGFARLVAVKTMRPEHADSDAFRRMFLDEARLAARIVHANVVEVLDLGREGEGIVYLAMTLVEGDSVAGLLRERRRIGARGLPSGVSARIIGDVLAGLHAAHELCDEEGRALQLVHRDVSPHNVLVGVDGVAKIADFGVAKARSRLADETEAGQVKGKFAYMAPEQLERRSVDRRADLFSAGVVLWEALTGARLFGGSDLIDTIAKIRETRIPDPREAAPEVPEAIARVVMRALERDPASRYATAAEMADALDGAARECGNTAGAKDVAVLVSELCGDALEARREAVRDAVRAVTTGGRAGGSEAIAKGATEVETATTTIVDAARAGGEARRSRLGIAFAGGAAVVVVGAAIVALRQTTAAATAPSASVATAVNEPTATPTSTPTSTATPTSTSTSTSSPTATSTSSPTATSTPIAAPPASVAPRPPRPRRAPSGPKVPYGNPYDR